VKKIRRRKKKNKREEIRAQLSPNPRPNWA